MHCHDILGEYGRTNVVEIRPARVLFEASNVAARNGGRVRGEVILEKALKGCKLCEGEEGDNTLKVKALTIDRPYWNKGKKKHVGDP